MKKLNLLFIALVFQCTVFSQNQNDVFNKDLPNIGNSNVEVLMRGDTIIVVDSSLTYVYDAENMRPVSKIWYKTNDDHGRNIVRFNYRWDIDEENYYLSDYDSLSYFDNNTVKELFTMTFDRTENRWYRSRYQLNNKEGFPLFDEKMSWDHNTAEYIYASQHLTTYVDELFMTSSQTNLYDNINNEWYNSTKNEFLLNDNYQLLESKAFKYDTIIDEWVYSTLHEYLRDEYGNDTLKRKNVWNLETNTWTLESKNQRSFNEDNQLIIDLQWEMEDDLENWIFDNKMEISYSPQGDKDTITYSKYYSEYDFWYFTKRQFLDYNSDHLITNVHSQNYDFVQEKWNDEYRTEWQYENKILDFYLREEWRSNAWHGDKRRQYSYNETGVLDTVIFHHSSGYGEDWDFGTRQSLIFNEDGNTEIFHYERLNDASEWETSRKAFYYYSAFILPNAISEFENVEFNIYPNPTTGQLSIELPDGLDENTIVFISDINGRMIKTIPMINMNNSIDLSEQSPGLYFMKIVNAGKSGTKKFILK